ncbi:hypothetical protein CGRA01v4_00093 [Colletotrichum graminicola]|nr:hypothetical protein CGRA01v4_00093 [Colletotrichum graminicola]
MSRTRGRLTAAQGMGPQEQTRCFGGVGVSCRAHYVRPIPSVNMTPQSVILGLDGERRDKIRVNPRLSSRVVVG